MWQRGGSTFFFFYLRCFVHCIKPSYCIWAYLWTIKWVTQREREWERAQTHNLFAGNFNHKSFRKKQQCVRAHSTFCASTKQVRDRERERARDTLQKKKKKRREISESSTNYINSVSFQGVKQLKNSRLQREGREKTRNSARVVFWSFSSVSVYFIIFFSPKSHLNSVSLMILFSAIRQDSVSENESPSGPW